MLLAGCRAAAALCDICVISARLCADKQNNYMESIVPRINGVIAEIWAITDASLFSLARLRGLKQKLRSYRGEGDAILGILSGREQTRRRKTR